MEVFEYLYEWPNLKSHPPFFPARFPSKRVDDGESDSYSDESEDKIESKDEIESKNDIEPVAKQEIKIFPGFLPNDVTLVVEEQHLHLNKDLLSSASPVFEAWLKKEWQQDECSDDTKRKLKFPGKTYDEMATFLKCLLPMFPDKVTDETLDTVFPLADEYRTETLITECVEVIRQRVESVYEVDIYIPPSRIVTYLLWIDKYNIHSLREALVELTSYLKIEEVENEPVYENIGLQLKLEMSNARAKLLESLFVSNITEAKERLYELKIPHSSYYLVEWKQHVAKLVKDVLASPVSENSTWPKTSAYKKWKGSSFMRAEPKISTEIVYSFACLDICDRLKYLESYAKVTMKIKSLEIGKADFKFIWSNYYSTDISNTNATMERLSLDICKCN
ncbi:hypothetical protein KP79_PYT23522 [Mizuhopecten yessoensis]|uniref:BTB domain-containing protein n=1 Tax=Mizuhopecten yessoensis TaxID=6573 RepID=A0A210QMR8_MIZYE|nr:hypothetical protein KP79_PYT23522 [Mizuhopecten yessoensis]